MSKVVRQALLTRPSAKHALPLPTRRTSVVQNRPLQIPDAPRTPHYSSVLPVSARDHKKVVSARDVVALHGLAQHTQARTEDLRSPNKLRFQIRRAALRRCSLDRGTKAGWAAREQRINRPITAEQASANLRELFSQARKCQPILQELMENLATTLGASVSGPADLKSLDRAQKKMDTDYQGRAQSLVDLCRGTIVADSIEGIYAALENIAERSDIDIVKWVDRFEYPQDNGYRDLRLVIRIHSEDLPKDGHLVELQVHQSAMHTAKELEHRLYDYARNIQKRGGDLSVEEHDFLGRLQNLSKDIYASALDALGASQDLGPHQKRRFAQDIKVLLEACPKSLRPENVSNSGRRPTLPPLP